VAVDGAEHLIKRRGTLFRVHVDEGDIEPFAVLLSFDQLFENRAIAAIRLWRALTGPIPVPIPQRCRKPVEIG
jgi:hypothetical protein